MYTRLLTTHTLEFIRKATDGGYNDDGDWVEGTAQPPFEEKGSLQPFQKGKSKVDLPKGVTAKDVRLFYTKADLLIADEYLDQEADKTTIEGIPYQVWHIEPWKGHGLRSGHNKVFLVREDKMNGS